jgi:hypothetical protein
MRYYTAQVLLRVLAARSATVHEVGRCSLTL